MTKAVAIPVCTLLFLVSSYLPAQDFGAAQPYNALVFDDFIASASDVEGRLAAGGHVELTSYAIAQQLSSTTSNDLVLLAGGNLTIDNSKIYFGSAAAGNSIAGVSNSVLSGLADGASVTGNAQLPINFSAIQSELMQLSASLAALEASTSIEYKWGGVYLTVNDCDATTQVFNLDGASLLSSNHFHLDRSCLASETTYIFNISGGSPGLKNMGLSDLTPINDHVVFNFYQATSITFQSIGVEGSVLAPLADITQPAGVIKGHLFAKSWNGPMQINHVPFAGDLPVENDPPVIVSEPIVDTDEQQAYQYQVIVEDPNERDVIRYELTHAPETMLIDADGTIHWTPDASWTQSVPTFNNQCYVVPTGSIKLYEAGDEASDTTYIAPLFQKVKEALELASSYTGVNTVAWDKRNGCLGCHVQTQTLLGLHASMDKADIDTESAEFLLNEILTSQQSNGSIRQSHPEYSKSQTAFALWALSHVQDIERTLAVRANGLAYMMSTISRSGDQSYWQPTHTTNGWLRGNDSITALVALSGAKFVADVQKLDNVSEEAAEIANRFSNEAPSILNYIQARAETATNETLWMVFRLIALAELKEFSEDETQLAEVESSIEWLDVQLRNRQLDNGGWSRYGNSQTADPLTSAWVGLALNYQHPPLTDPVVTNNIQYLLDSQSANGTWVTTSGLFTTHLATTSLVMAYLPVALEHLGNPDVSAGGIYLAEADDGVHQLSAKVTNRGLADVTSPVTVNFYNGRDEQALLGSVDLPALLSGEQSTATISVNDSALSDHVYISLSSASDADECEISNNRSHAALVRVKASDPHDEFDTQVYTLNVLDVNEAPTISSEAPEAHQAGQGLIYQVKTDDGDEGDGHSYTLVDAPANVYIDSNTGKLTAAPGVLAPGTYDITVKVTDLRGASTTQTFNITVHANEPPEIISVAVEMGDENAGYQYDVEAVDPNNDELSYALEIFPQGAAINKTSGMVDWVSDAKYIEPMSASNGFCLGTISQNFSEVMPVVKWTLDFPISSANVYGPVSVAQMTDDNNDGLINSDDNTDIIFVIRIPASSAIAVADGATGKLHWYRRDIGNTPFGSTAVADIDADGIPEIYVSNSTRSHLLKFSNTGELEWSAATGLPTMTNARDGINVADLTGDGVAEIILGVAVFDASGKRLWVGSRDRGGDINYGLNPVVADIDLDGMQEVIAGRTIYKFDGSVAAHASEISSDGFTALGNFDDDDQAEVVVVGNGKVSLYNSDGTVIWANVSIPGGGYGGAPTIGDFDGDGLPEIGVAGANNYIVYEHDGSIKWSSPTRDSSSHRTGSSLFDFNSDGKIEVVYADEYYLRVYDGSTGDVLIEEENRSGTTLEYPVIADVDNDDNAEIVVGSNSASGTLRVLESANNDWAPTRAIWNQHAYNINNINDDLTVPAQPVKSWLAHNTFRLNTFPDRPALGLADVTVANIRFDESSKTLSADIINRGLAPVTDALTVNFVHEHSWSGDTVLGSVTVASLAVNETAKVALTIDDISVLEQTIRVEVIPSDNTVECLTNNNMARAVVMQVGVYDEAQENDKQMFAVAITNTNDRPTMTSSASNSFAEKTAFSFSVEVTDSDIGDDHRFELLDAPAGVSIGEYSGAITSDGLNIGSYAFTIRAYDLAGEFVDQAHLLTITVPDNYAPEITSDAVTSATIGEAYEYQVTATDADGDALQFFMSRTQPGVSINTETGLIQWTPSENDKGLKALEVTVIDPQGGTDKQYFLVDILAPETSNNAPVITSTPSGVVTAGQLFSYQVEASDPDGDALSFSVTSDESSIEISTAGLVTWLPSVDLIGQAVVVEVIVSDGRGGLASQKLTLPVNDSANNPPTFTSTPALSVFADTDYQYVLTATDSDGDAFTFELVDSPNGMTLTGNTVAWVPSSLQAKQVFNVTVKVTDVRGAASTQSFSIAVNEALPDNYAPVISSLPSSPATVGQEYRYQVVASDADGDALTYALATDITGASVNSDGLLTWTPTEDQVGTYRITLNVNDGRATVAQSFTLDVVSNNANINAFGINSEPTSPATVGVEYQYDVTVVNATGDTVTYTLDAAPSAMTLSQSGELRWTPGQDQVGSHDVVIKAADGQAEATQTYVLQAVAASADNTAPVISSLPSSPATVGQEYRYQVIASDADGDALTYSLATDITGASVNSDGLFTWTPTEDQIGSRSLQLVVSDGTVEVSQRFTLDVVADTSNAAPVITSTPRTEAAVDIAYQYAFRATDADGDVLTYGALTLPSGASIDSNGLMTWTPTSEQTGIHDVVLTVDDGQIRALQSFSIAVFDEPQAIEVLVTVDPQYPTFGDLVDVQVLTSGGRDTLTHTLTVNGTEHALDAYGRASILANSYGVNTIEITTTDGTHTVTESSWFSVTNPNDTDAPEVALHSPADDDTVTAPADVVATVSDANLKDWVLYLKGKNTAATAYTELARGNGTVSNAVIGQLDPTMLHNGQYSLILEATDINNASTQAVHSVVVDGDMKLGHFAMTFEDLNVDLAGIPIQVTRTYDTRQRNEALDFGYGWSIDYQNVRVQESRTTGFSWSLNYYRTGFFGQYCVEPNGDPIVSVRLPGGDVEKFRAKATPECTSIVPTVDVQISFEALDGTHSTLTQSDYGLLRIVNGNIVDLGEPNRPIDADHYTLTTQDGMVYSLDQSFGLRKVTEPGGQSISYSDAGIVHSAGYKIDFERDAYNRITALVLPDGRRVAYGYSHTGDLASVTDLGQNATQLNYVANVRAPHYLEDVIDPLGNRATKMVYDDDGRLIEIIDALGNVVQYDHDIAGNTETVYDRNGQPTTYVYDDRGYVLSETNALGDTITRTYTEHGDVLTETNALGDTTTWTYNERGFQTSETNALGEMTAWTYTNNGNLLTETNSQGDVVLTNTYNPRTLKLTSSVDALGNSTQFRWDTQCGTLASTGYTDALNNATRTQVICNGDFAGKTRSETDANGHKTEYDYDAAGRKIQQTQWRTEANGTQQVLVTQYEYDDQDQLIKTTYPDGSTTQTEYTAGGQVAAEIDASGQRTEYSYNARGEEIEVRYPDGTTTSKTYEANGNVLSETDRAGQTTTMSYDAAGRLVATMYPDDTPFDDSDNPRSTSEYNAAGQLVASVDANGNRTEYGYNANGQRTQTRDALGNITTFEYDAQGRQTTMVDAQGNRIEYTYDALDRRIATTYADGSQTQTAYDALGRKVSETDELGRVTQYQYSATGQLLKVIDANLGETTFTYDAQGNKTTQTDANGNTTTWAYDVMGRVISRTLPEGQVETFIYNDLGQMIERIDFNGNATRYAYDLATGYQTQVDYALDGQRKSYTYEANGLTQSITTESGTVQYQYDAQSRLIEETQADGTVLRYAYDANGNKTQLTVTRNGQSDITTYGYDALNRLSTVTDSSGITRYTYDAVGNLASVTYGNGTVTTYQYNAKHQLTRLITSDTHGTVLTDYQYSLARDGRRDRIVESHSNRTTDYGYDVLNRLLSETITDASNGDYSATYEYDKVGNRTYETVNGVQTAYTYNANDWLMQAGGITYAYDANGNTLTDSEDGTISTYQYNGKNQLVSAETATVEATYQYNPAGIRIGKTENGERTHYVVDSNRDYAQVIVESTGGNTANDIVYRYGHDLISQQRNNATSYYHYDGLGSTRALTDENGSIAQQYDYDAFGSTLNESGSLDNAYRFTGEQYDATLDQYYLRARYYNQDIGRFTQMDTYQGRNSDPVTLHKYLYANVNPVMFTDPSGYMSLMSVSAANNIMGNLMARTTSRSMSVHRS